MQRIQINIRDIVTIDGISYIVEDIVDNKYVLFELGTSKTIFQFLAPGEIKMLNLEKRIFVENKPPKVLNLSNIDKADIAFMMRRKEVLDAAIDKIRPCYDVIQHRKGKDMLQFISQELSISYNRARELLHSYLASGRDEWCLIDQRMLVFKSNETRKYVNSVPGRFNSDGTKSKVISNNETYAIFEEAFQYYQKKAKNITEAYDYMLTKHYSEKDGIMLLPEDEIPSYGRFYRYVKGRRNGLSASIFGTSEKEQRNNTRLKKGSFITNVYYPGHILEMDEVEVDLEIISVKDTAEKKQNLGRPVVYFLIDVYTQVIVGFSCGYENNSYIGFINTIETLLTPHSMQAKRLNVECDDELFPSCFLPKKIRTDQGSEYDSHMVEDCLARLGIEHEITSPATGSMKGVVESSFHSFQQDLKKRLAGKNGYNSNKYDSEHKKTAILNIEDLRKYLYSYITQKNSKVFENYLPKPEELTNGMELTPIGKWKYATQNGMPLGTRVVSQDQIDNYRFQLMETGCFKISRDGITCGRNLYYWSDNPFFVSKMNAAGDKKEIINGIRYDRRTINYIYYLLNGQLLEIPLNTQKGNLADYIDYSWEEFRDAEKAYNTIIRNREHTKKQNRISSKIEKNKIVEMAKKREKNKVNTDKDKREARKAEKYNLNKKDAKEREKLYKEIKGIEIDEPKIAENKGPDYEEDYYDFLED